MITDFVRKHLSRDWSAAAASAAAVVLGALAGLQSGAESFAPTAFVLPPILAVMFGPKARVASFVAVLSMMMVGMGGVMVGSYAYFGDITEAVMSHGVVLAVASALALFWTIPRWLRLTGTKLGFAMAAVAVIALLPPFWIMGGLAHPVVGFGYFWPGGGWVAVTVGLAGLAAMTAFIHGKSPVLQVALVLLVLVSGWLLRPDPLNVRGNERFRAVSTEWGSRDDGTGGEIAERLGRVRNLIERLAPLGVTWLVLPEATISRWTPATEDLYISEVASAATSTGMTVWMGVNKEADGSPSEVGTLMFTPQGRVEPNGNTANRATVHVELARQPMPMSIWRPWAPAGPMARWSDLRPLQSPAGPVWVSICYEDLMPGMVMAGLLIHGRPTAIVSMASNWYLPTATQRIHARHIEGIARLYRLPLLRATNTARPDKP